MPFQDGTGPQGQGPRTGRGQGNCNGQGGTGGGRGLGRGRGFGRGRGGVNLQQGASPLKARLDALQTAIEKLSEKIGQGK
ncbi:MAG: DUF5320 domain-containing protein [Anaerolineales bacterium]|nr:hypothetical protein [Anaerolineales bacterium]MCC7511539.1 DUF5320 domain-containing protein [Anaerolineae bacterium]GER80934.1 conserved hypothetical protein [Candidatus Denitrolinea symbiosum]MBW7918414.1 DUF5320 domain-containing protein [Anaerolineales bacterium]MCZ2287772.1 DUF5320 domain-containing protein [Anaerolineales bacterium]